MYNIMRNSTSGLIANQEKINITSNNIVNSQTTGYKKLETGFIDLYTTTLDKISYPNNSKGAITGTGVKISNAIRNLTQGALNETGIQSNLAIEGDGYFSVTRPNGNIAYTRCGEFSIDANGRLVDDNGNVVNITYNNGFSANNVNFSQENLTINDEGEVFVDDNEVGKINLYMPQGSNDLTSIGNSLFELKEESNMIIVENSSIKQGYIEMSNVNLETEMSDLITLQRAFQFNSKGMQAVDEMWGMINNLQSR